MELIRESIDLTKLCKDNVECSNHGGICCIVLGPDVEPPPNEK